MKILFLTQVLPYPLDAGPKVRAYYTLRQLAQRHEVTLVSFVRAADTLAAQQHLQALCQRLVTVPMPRTWWREAAAMVNSLRRGIPLLITRDQVPAMHGTVTSLIEQGCFEAIHADQLWMAPYALAARAQSAARGCKPLTVLDQHNAVYLVPQRMAVAERSPIRRALLRREARLMARYEAVTCQAFDRVVTVTEADRDALMDLPAGPRLAAPIVIPICVDPSAAHPKPPPVDGRVLFLGGMHWPPNADGVKWFVQSVWPAVRARVPAAEFWAIGKKPPAGIASAAEGRHAPGYAPELDEHWARAQTFVVPLLSGGGMRVKILDAWLRGLPVVATTVGAEGLATVPGENILIADTPADFAGAVTRVLTEPALAARLAAGGRAAVVQHYDWRAVYPRWETVYEARYAAGAYHEPSGASRRPGDGQRCR